MANGKLLEILKQLLASKRMQGYIVSVIVTLFSSKLGIPLSPELVAEIITFLTGILGISEAIRPMIPSPVLIKVADPEVAGGEKVMMFNPKTGEKLGEHS